MLQLTDRQLPEAGVHNITRLKWAVDPLNRPFNNGLVNLPGLDRDIGFVPAEFGLSRHLT
jgi:hypothetical protein